MKTQPVAARPKLTAIVPLYDNVDRIALCLESIRAQSYGDYEAIVVDDGSDDGSRDAAEAFCKTDARFTLLPRSHAGVSAARNAGLERARGEYVTFIDADDVLPADAFKWMHQSTVVYDADTVCGVYERIDGITAYRNAHAYRLANKARRIGADDLDLIHSWSLCNKWLSLDVIRQGELRFEDLGHLEDAVFLYGYLRGARAICTCPHTIYTYRKPLPVEGRTTTQGASAALLADAKRAYARLKELTCDYGPAFEAELDYRFLNTPLIGDYYRRLWRTDNALAETLAAEIDAQLRKLDPAHRERALSSQFDLLTDTGVRTKTDLLASPLVSVIVERSVTARLLPTLLSGLYDQSETSFEVLVDAELESALPDEFARMPNLSLFRGDEAAALDGSRGRFIAFLDDEVIYDHRSLATMARALHRDEGLACVELGVSRLDGASAELPEGSLANRLFRTEALRGDTGALRKAAAMLEPKRLKKPVVISMRPAPEAKLERAGETGARTSHEGTPESTVFVPRPSLLERIKQTVLGRSGCKTPTEARRKPAPAPRNRRIPTSEFYLNLDVDPDLVVVEGLGKRPRGNTLYLVQELQRPEYGQLRVVFSVTEATRASSESVFEERGFENVSCLVAGSDDYKRALFSAGVLFNEVDFPNWWIKKPRQTYVNIWHGTPLKKLGRAKGGIVHRDANASRNFTMADYVLCANDYSVQHILGDCDVLGLTRAKALMLGYPRTAILFDGATRAHVRENSGLAGKQVVAWMPTYRDYLTGDAANSFLREMDRLLSPDQVLYVNLHHKTAAQVSYDGLEHVRPFPPGIDTYEFLCGADALVTDYSSVMFDFAVTHREIVLHCPDKEEYERERGLYRSVDDLPFPVTHDVPGLVAALNATDAYDDSGFVSEFCPHDSPSNTRDLCRLAILGDTGGVELRDASPHRVQPTFVVSDGLPPGPATDLLYKLSDRGSFAGGVYLSFLEQEVDKNLESAYPLVERVPLYATKGRPISERSEQQRLYNDLDPRAVVVVETSSAKRVRCFARFDVPVYLFVQEGLLQAVREDAKTLKALKLFAKWGNGMFAMSRALADQVNALIGAEVEVVATAAEFEKRFL